MRYPRLGTIRTSREMIDTFKGLDMRTRIGEGWFSDMENLTSDHYPVMAPRKSRGVVLDIDALPAFAMPREGVITGAISNVRHGMLYTQGANLYTFSGFNSPVELDLEDSTKQLICMGSLAIILPDMKYVNLENLQDYGPLGHRVEATSGTVTVKLCDAEGTAYGDRAVADTAPEAPENGDLWVDTSGDTHCLKRYTAATDQWVTVATTYVMISGTFTNMDGMWFSQYDGVRISGLSGDAAHLNGAAVLQTGSGFVIAGLIDQNHSQECSETEIVRIERETPVMDYMIEHENRLWGCRYGENNEGDIVNEIYCSKLGDPKNWNCFMGIATDSWVGSVGSPGMFTGAAVVDGHPVFYKEGVKHKIWPSTTGAHQVTQIPCQGITRGCARSVASIDGAVIYKSSNGFCIDDGGIPVEIGYPFAGKDYTDAVGAVVGRKYYVSMQGDGGWHLFVYDTQRKLWHREDDLHAKTMFGQAGFAITGDGKRILDLRGNVKNHGSDEPVRWMAQTGEFGLDMPNMKRLRKLILRLSMEIGAEMACYIRYDGDQEWTYLFTLLGSSLRSFSVPVRPRRCDHFQLRLEGVGDVKLWSITKIMDEGSDKS